MIGITIGGPYPGTVREVADSVEQWAFTTGESEDSVDGLFVYNRWPDFDIFTRPDNAVAFTAPDVVIRQLQARVPAADLLLSEDPEFTLLMTKKGIEARAILEGIKYPPISRGVWVHSISTVTGEHAFQLSWLAVNQTDVPDLPDDVPQEIEP